MDEKYKTNINVEKADNDDVWEKVCDEFNQYLLEHLPTFSTRAHCANAARVALINCTWEKDGKISDVANTVYKEVKRKDWICTNKNCAEIAGMWIIRAMNMKIRWYNKLPSKCTNPDKWIKETPKIVDSKRWIEKTPDSTNKIQKNNNFVIFGIIATIIVIIGFILIGRK